MLERIIASVANRQSHHEDPKELHKRSFKIETLKHGEQTLQLISFEATYAHDERITPRDWQEQIRQVIEQVDIVFVEYFPPELEQNIPYFGELGEYSRGIGESYGTITELAHHLNIPVAVADIANKPLYELYQMGIYPAIGTVAVMSAYRGDALGKIGFAASQTFIGSSAYQAALQKGKYALEPGTLERYTPDATDARRALTARAIMQTAREMPDASFAYIGAPAHIARIKTALTEPTTVPESAKALVYKSLIGLDRSTRIYEPTENGWELVSNIPIQ